MQRVLIYNEAQGLLEHIPPDFHPRAGTAHVWVDLVQPSPEELDILSSAFSFHPLAIADCRRPHFRPGLVQYEGYSFLTLRCVAPQPQPHALTTFLNIFVGPTYVVTVHAEKLDFLDTLWASYHENPSLFQKGTDFLLYRLLEPLTAAFFPFFDRLEDKIEKVEEEIFRRPDRKVLNQIFILRRQVIKLRKFLGPQRDIINLLSHPEFPLVKAENRVFFLDIYNEMLRLVDQVETFHDLTSSALEIYLSLTSNRLNEIMKVLTVITTIMMPLTLIAGIYGMNFRYMPELEWRYGYYWALGWMVLVALIMLGYFRKKGWF